ncbi:MAG: hypothetical protein GX267_11450 [Fibrobacter sp.]|jgi:hypothetical protein|nr:hypothetical protein [Fibrobacter sp.]
MINLNRNALHHFFIYVVFFLTSGSFGEPIVIKGFSVKELLGTPIEKIRFCTRDYQPVVFQIDEMTEDGEYVCSQGENPNSDSGNGILDSLDELVFLWEDCQPLNTQDSLYSDNKLLRLRVSRAKEIREICICKDGSVPVSSKRYIYYDHESRMLRTPWYYAEFGLDRFHFVKAGVKKEDGDRYVDLTNELRIEILLRALWGLIPIRYSEDNMVCLVKRFKTGPLRLIRRGDFHLNLGLGLRGSRAIVNQICYPQIIKVPVYVHAPVRFGSFFRDAYIEMTPVLKDVPGFSFRIPQAEFSRKIGGEQQLDTMIYLMPNHQFMAVSDDNMGYGWVLKAEIEDQYLKNSSFIYRKPSLRLGSVDCGFRLNIHNLPRGYYEITNWVFFQSGDFASFKDEFRSVIEPAIVTAADGDYQNELSASGVHKKLSD